ncbi:hypothetical protein MP213Fo_09390 [Pseudochrobactrum sp. MP213Fo]
MGKLVYLYRRGVVAKAVSGKVGTGFPFETAIK